MFKTEGLKENVLHNKLITKHMDLFRHQIVITNNDKPLSTFFSRQNPSTFSKTH